MMFSRICNSIPHIPYIPHISYLQQRTISNCFIDQEQKITIKIPGYLKERINYLHTCKKQYPTTPHTTVILAQNPENLLRPLSKSPLISYSIENMCRSNFNYFPVTATTNEKISELALSLGSLVLEYPLDQFFPSRITIAKDFVNAFNLHDKLVGASINFLSPHHPFFSSQSINSAISFWTKDALDKREVARCVSGDYFEKQKLMLPYEIKKLCTNGLESFTFKQFIFPTYQVTSYFKFQADQKEALAVVDAVGFRIAEEILNPS